MKAIVCKQHGGPETLELLEIPDPVIGAGELLVRLHSSSINFPDVLTIDGRYQVKHPLPFVPGAEGAGTVEALGTGVTGFAVGDRVAVFPKIGTFAEKVAVHASAAIRLPDGIPFDFAATFTITYGTSYLALARQAALRSGETVLVLGASGGVGIAAVEIAKALGAKVIAAASSPEKLEMARAAGADELVDYEREDLKSVVKLLTGGRVAWISSMTRLAAASASPPCDH
jgi:NADPH2:quinone reductase